MRSLIILMNLRILVVQGGLIGVDKVKMMRFRKVSRFIIPAFQGKSNLDAYLEWER